MNAVYTRSTDVYDTPYQKAEMGNEAGVDYFVSLHRNAASEPGKGSGVMTLVYKTGRESEQLADSIQRELARTGYVDLGVIERPDLIVLRITQMPAVLVEAGFIDNPEDNKRFDAQFDENDKLFSVTFHEQLARGTAEEHFEAASKRFTETFGAPAVQDDNGTGTQYLEWQDKSSGTALGLTYSDLGTTDPTLMISVFEKSRYVEAGTGEWK